MDLAIFMLHSIIVNHARLRDLEADSMRPDLE
jgi:hypothetical protein